MLYLDLSPLGSRLAFAQSHSSPSHSTALTYYRAYPAQLRVCHMEMLFLGAVSTAIQCERSFSPRTRPPRAIRPRHGSFPVTARTDMTHISFPIALFWIVERVDPVRLRGHIHILLHSAVSPCRHTTCLLGLLPGPASLQAAWLVE